MDHFGPFIPFNYPTNQQFGKSKKKTYQFHHSAWVYQKAYSYGLRLPRNDLHISTGYLGPSLPFPHFLAQKLKKKHLFLAEKSKNIPEDIIILHLCTKNHLIFNSQNMMWIAFKSFWDICAFYPIFGQKNQNFWKREKKGYVIILQLHSKNHNDLMYSSLKMMVTALQIILGQFLPLYSILGPKLKFSKKEKMPKTY